MDSHSARLPSATPGKGDGPTESYKERAIRYRAEVHSLRAEVKTLKDEISLMRQHSDSTVSDSAGHLIEGRSVADWANHARELEDGMNGLVDKAEEASQKYRMQRDALMESLHAVKKAELEAVSKWRSLEDELLASQLTVRRYEDRSLPLPPQAGSDESVIELAGNVGDVKPAAAPTSSTSISSNHPVVAPISASATNVFVAALQAKMDAVVGAGEDSSDDSFGLCVDAKRDGSDSGDDYPQFEDDESSEHSIHDSSGRQRVMYLQQASSGSPLHAGLNTDIWRRGVYDPTSSSVRLDDGVSTTTDWARLSAYDGSVADGDTASQQHLNDVARRTTGELAGVAGLRGIVKPVPKRAFYAVANGHRTGVFDMYSEVHPLVDGFSGAVYMAFWTAAEAQRWLDEEHAARVVRVSAPSQSATLRSDAAIGARRGHVFYAVLVGRQIGVFNTWHEAKASTNGFSGARHKSFNTYDEASAWLRRKQEQAAIREATLTAGRLRDDRVPTQMPGASAVATLAGIGAADIQLGVGLHLWMTQRVRHIDSPSAPAVSHAAASSQASPLRHSLTDSDILDGSATRASAPVSSARSEEGRRAVSTAYDPRTAVPSPRPSPQRTPSSSVANSAQRTPPTAPSSLRSPPSSGGSLGSRVARSASVLTKNHGFSRRASGLDEPCVTRQQSRLAGMLASAGIQLRASPSAPDESEDISSTVVQNGSVPSRGLIATGTQSQLCFPDMSKQSALCCCSMCGATDCRSAECDAVPTPAPTPSPTPTPKPAQSPCTETPITPTTTPGAPKVCRMGCGRAARYQFDDWQDLLIFSWSRDIRTSWAARRALEVS